MFKQKKIWENELIFIICQKGCIAALLWTKDLESGQKNGKLTV